MTQAFVEFLVNLLRAHQAIEADEGYEIEYGYHGVFIHGGLWDGESSLRGMTTAEAYMLRDNKGFIMTINPEQPHGIVMVATREEWEKTWELIDQLEDKQ